MTRLCLFCIGLLLIPGCATRVDPSRPSPGLGYIDFFGNDSFFLQEENPRGLFDDVGKFGHTVGTRSSRKSILRVPRPAGKYSFWVALDYQRGLPHAHLLVEVKEGMVTPVQVTFTAKGSAPTEQRKIINAPPGKAFGTPVGPTWLYSNELVHAPYGPIEGSVSPSIGFRPQVQMPYYPEFTGSTR